MKTAKYFFSIILIFSFYIVFSQNENPKLNFKLGENLFFNVYYKVGFIWVKAATVNFQVLDDKKAFDEGKYHFYGLGKTANAYKWIYNVNDKYESFADINMLKTISFIKNKSENSYTSEVKYQFDNSNNTIHVLSQNSEGRNINKTIKNENFARDILTTMYYARNIEFNINKGQILEFWVIQDGVIQKLKAVFEGIESIEIKKQQRECFKFSSNMPKGSLFGSQGKLTVWVSTDKNRIPVKVIAEIIIGSVVVEIQEAKQLKFPEK